MIAFKDWPEKERFTFLGEKGQRFGVKLSGVDGQPFRAFMFDTDSIEKIHFNKKVEAPPTIQGRLARTRDNKLVIVKELQKNSLSGYYVTLSGTKFFDKSEIRLIPVEAGNVAEKFTIIMKKLRELHKDQVKLLETIEILLE